MEIDPKIMSASIKDFKLFGKTSEPYLMRKYKTSYGMAKLICEAIEKRFPNLWKMGLK